MAPTRRIMVPPGEQFGKLTVVREIEQGPGVGRKILCSCSCGNSKIADIYNLVRGKILSCGCVTYAHTPKARAAMLRKWYDLARVTDEGRLCYRCDTWKRWADFRSDPRRSRGKHSVCAECMRWYNIKRVFGIDKDTWTYLSDLQNGVCALCAEEDPKQNLSVDHNHSCCGSEKACMHCIRGLLCSTCNRVLGLLEKKPAVAIRFADYLTQRPLLHLAEQSPA